MEVIEFLDEKLIETSMDASNKYDAITKMSELLNQYGYVSNVDDFRNDVLKREEMGETGIGNYIAIPHGQSNSVLKTTICICKLKNEIEWETLDGKGVKVILLFAVEADVNFAKTHLMLLASVARKLGNEKVITDLLNANSSKDIMNCFQ